jgi:hypothetical protein
LGRQNVLNVFIFYDPTGGFPIFWSN